jgi:hypothetical protein
LQLTHGRLACTSATVLDLIWSYVDHFTRQVIAQILGSLEYPTVTIQSEMPAPTEILIQKLYHNYQHAADIDAKGLFFSPTCIQICKPMPSFAATTREQIVQYLKDAEKGNVPSVSDDSLTPSQGGADPTKRKPRGNYTIRPLVASEHTFTDPSLINLTPSQLLQQSKEEAWIGMRVDLWGMDVEEEGLLVKVQYWWREEDVAEGEELEGDVAGRGWRQCAHDIIYLGPRDGSEGSEGETVKI